MSPNAVVTAELMLAGFTQLPDRNPFIKPELRKLPTAVPVWPSSMFRNPEMPVVAVFEPGAKGLLAPDSGEANPCRAVGSAETTCDSVDCTPALDDVPVAWATAPAWLAAADALVVSVVNDTATT